MMSSNFSTACSTRASSASSTIAFSIPFSRNSPAPQKGANRERSDKLAKSRRTQEERGKDILPKMGRRSTVRSNKEGGGKHAREK